MVPRVGDGDPSFPVHPLEQLEDYLSVIPENHLTENLWIYIFHDGQCIHVYMRVYGK